jgi:hypothetical protein
MASDARPGRVGRAAALTARAGVGLILAAVTASHAAAQPKEAAAALEKALLGREVRARVDMPAASAGIDLYLQKEPEYDAAVLAERISSYGVAIRQGQTTLITKVKVNKKNIELQLGGGGWGTFADDNGLVVAKLDEPSPRQKELERERKRTTDPKRKKDIDRELNELRESLRRQHEEAFRHARAITALNQKEIARKRLDAGSRFNIWYADKRLEQWAPTAEELMYSLADYLELVPVSAGAPRVASSSPAVSNGGGGGATAANVRRGMTPAQVYDALGFPTRRKVSPQGELDGSVETWETRTQVIEVTFVGGVAVNVTTAKR